MASDEHLGAGCVGLAVGLPRQVWQHAPEPRQGRLRGLSGKALSAPAKPSQQAPGYGQAQGSPVQGTPQGQFGGQDFQPDQAPGKLQTQGQALFGRLDAPQLRI
jgi:hypothetical protein